MSSLKGKLLQFALCGSAKSGKCNPYEAVEPVNRQRILLLINSKPLDAERIAKKLNLDIKETREDLMRLKECGLIKEANNQYLPSFPIFTLKDQMTLSPLLNKLSSSVKSIVEKRLSDVRKLVGDLECTKRGLNFSDLEYIIVGAITLDYEALEVFRDEELLLPEKEMPGGSYIFSGFELGLIDLRKSWMWGHNSVYGKYWFSTHGRIPKEGRRAFPDLAWRLTSHIEWDWNKIEHMMKRIGEILELLSIENLSVKDLSAKTKMIEEELLIELALLETLQYIVSAENRWKINRPFFTTSDLEKIRGLSESILKEISSFFKGKLVKIKELYDQTSPSKNKIIFKESFNPLYHLIFENTLNLLIESKAINSPAFGKDGEKYSPFIGIEMKQPN